MMKNALSSLLCAWMAFVLLPTAALAVGDGVKTEMDISKGNITINESSVSGKDNENKDVSTHDPDGYRIIQSDGVPTTTNTIKVTGGEHDITLSGVNIAANSETAAFSISGGASVYLTLVGSNTLIGATGQAGLMVPSGAKLTINGTDADSLTATGGNGNMNVGGGAGIGSDSAIAAGIIFINGGDVTATGGTGGTVNITGGKVNATGKDGGAGIGGGGGNNPAGNGGAGALVTITGGEVTATGHGIQQPHELPRYGGAHGRGAKQ